MWWTGRGNSGDLWLPEEKKANLWHERGNSSGSWPPAFPLVLMDFMIIISPMMSLKNANLPLPHSPFLSPIFSGGFSRFPKPLRRLFCILNAAFM